MANEQNLVSLATRTKRERSEIGRKGAEASNKVKREKATMRAVLEAMLNEVPTNNNPQGLTYKQMATLGLIKGAVKGNAMNYKTMIEALGEDKQQATANNGVIDNLIEALNNARK